MAYSLAPLGPATGLRGMVSAADHLAATAGVGLLARGGSAADAAVGAAAVMAVTSPYLCGMGGDMLAVVSAPGSDPVALLGIGRAGSGVDAARLRAEGHTVMPVRGDFRSVPVPGAVDGWLALHARFGRLPLDEVLHPAVGLAEEGFVASLMLSLASHMVYQMPGAQELCPDGPLPLEAHVRLPSVARTLRAIAADGRAGFYGGEFGRNLVELGGGVYARADLEKDCAQWCTPSTLRVWDHDLWTVPAPSQGYLTLAGSWIAERVGLGTDPTDPEWAHLVIEAARAAGHDRPEVLYDRPDGQSLLDEERLANAASRIRPDRAAPPDVAPGTSAGMDRGVDGDTTHLCAVDADGLGVSLTQSNALDFGSHLVAGSTGVFLHNRGVGFSLVPGHPAEVAPGTRPPHTLSPMLATRPDGSLAYVAGAMGGDTQPHILQQVLARMLQLGQDPATAVTAARVSLAAAGAGPFRMWWGDDLMVLVEGHAPPTWAPALKERGHRVFTLPAFEANGVGGIQIIKVVRDGDGEGGGGERHFVGAADPRSPCAGVGSR